MYKTPYYRNSQGLAVNQAVAGKTIEQKIEQLVNNKEPIGQGNDSAPIIYTERKEGVRASTNIRTDRFEIAIDAADKIAKSYKARREERGAAAGKEKTDEKKEGDGGAKPIQGETGNPVGK